MFIFVFEMPVPWCDTRGDGVMTWESATCYIFDDVPFMLSLLKLFFMRLKIFMQASVLHLVICLWDIDMCRVYVVTHVADILGTILRISL